MTIATIIQSNKIRILLFVFGVPIVLAIALMLNFHVSPLSWGWYQPFDAIGGTALDGFDPVSYHTTGSPRKGAGDTFTLWKGVVWHFASPENLRLFQEDEEKYAPQFGGHCAQAVSSGFTASANPEVWHILNGKLYLFLNSSAKQKWIANIDKGIVGLAERQWASNAKSNEPD